VKEMLIDNIDDYQWYNIPRRIDEKSDGYVFHTKPETDFWQTTHYGFQRDDGHFFYRPVSGDFDVQLDLSLMPNAKYDQGGLMVRIDTDNWIKTSVEFEPVGSSHYGTVVTQNAASDWSMRPVSEYPTHQSYRIIRSGCDYTIYSHLGSGEWERLRVTRLQANNGGEVLVGFYGCSPTGNGCPITVSRLKFN